MKTILIKVIIPDDGADNVYDSLLDHVFLAYEGVEIKTKIRKSTKKEKKAWEENNDE